MTEDKTKPKRRQIGSLVKGLRILETITAATRGVKVSEIARTFEMPTSNLTLFLNSLVDTGYVIKNPFDGRYYPSEKIIHIASSIDTRYKRLEICAQKEMSVLHERYDENVLLAVLNNFRLQFISTLQSKRNIQILNNDNRYFIPHVTAAGKAILSFLPQKMLADYFAAIELERFTDKTVTDLTLIEGELANVRAKGYAINRGEYEPEVMAVAAPVFAGDTVQGSLTVQFPTFRYDEAVLDAHGQEIIESARSVSRAFEAETVQLSGLR
jgi:DNA-binding IclR family transcriptional regulator